MQYEDFDSKVRDAADNHHPAYDEQAWGKMETLLDEHMPQEKDDRRRFIFFLLFFLLLGGAVVFITKPWSKGKSIAAKESITNSTEQKPTPENVETRHALSPKDVTSPKDITFSKEVTSPKDATSSNEASSPETGTISQSEVVSQNTVPKTDKQTTATNNRVNNIQKKNSKPNTSTNFEYTASTSATEKKTQKQKNTVATNTPTLPAILKNSNQQISTEPEVRGETLVNSNSTEVTNSKTSDTPPVAIDKKNATATETEPVVKKEEVAQQKEIKKEKPKSTKSNSFFFSLSAGPDVSAAGGEKLGKVKLLAGFGLGYTFKERLTLRTGFYSGRKVYAASPDEYNPPADFWNYYPYLEKVEADCKVYEIPVSLSYNFGKSTKHNLFASVGLSSYLMKKETYNYYYKYAPNTPTLNAKWTVLNENKHLFSVVTLSGGYQRKISKSVSLMIEPYIKLPLSGVGYGKVKLNSGGMLMTLSIKPFQKIKKEK